MNSLPATTASPGAPAASARESTSLSLQLYAPLRPLPQSLNVFYGAADIPGLSHYLMPLALRVGYPVIYLDGANRFDPLLLARLARELGRSPSEFNRQIRVARAFTCFQLTELLERGPRLLQKFPAKLVIVTALPDLHFDEDVRAKNAEASFRQALAALRRLARQRVTIAVFSEAIGFHTPRMRFFAQLTRQADAVWKLTEPPGRPSRFLQEKSRRISCH